MKGYAIWNQDVLYDAKTRIFLAKEQDIDDTFKHDNLNGIALIGKTGFRMFMHDQDESNLEYESLVYIGDESYTLLIFKHETAMLKHWEKIKQS